MRDENKYFLVRAHHDGHECEGYFTAGTLRDALANEYGVPVFVTVERPGLDPLPLSRRDVLALCGEPDTVGGVPCLDVLRDPPPPWEFATDNEEVPLAPCRFCGDTDADPTGEDGTCWDCLDRLTRPAGVAS